MKKIITILIICILTSCNQKTAESNSTNSTIISIESEKIKVLNFATFHMGSTTDANSVNFDEEDKKNQEDAKKIAKIISKFNPTVICVEMPPEDNSELNEKYQEYLTNPDSSPSYYGEISLIAFEVGRLNNINNLYGIDHKLEYNYNINNDLTNKIDSLTFNAFQANPFASIPELNVFEDNLSLMEKLKRINHPKFLDILIIANADMLTFVGSEEGFEGADEATKYYQRNLRIYSNLNRIPLTIKDRVFILSGGSHTAFLNEFMKRSPKYEVVNTLEYLN